jgi:hypothetical protein
MIVQRMSPGEMEAFSRKLEAFGGQLSTKEQALFAEILLRAASAPEEDDVEGHMFDVATQVIASGLPHHMTHLAGLSWIDFHHHVHSLIQQIGGFSRTVPVPGGTNVPK